MLTIVRTAFLSYVRVLLCLQGMYLGLWTWVWWPGEPPQFWAPHGLALLFPFPGLAGIVAAFLLRPGRRWAAIAAILIEVLWAAMAAALGYKTLKDWPLDWQFLWLMTAATALFLVAVAGPAASARPRLRRARSPLIARAGLHRADGLDAINSDN